MTITLHARLGQPYTIGVYGATGSPTLVVDVEDPDLSVVQVTTEEVDASGVYRGTFTPAAPGTHTLTVDDSAAANVSGLDGSSSLLVVTVDGPSAPAAAATWYPTDTAPSGAALRWPCPTLASLACIAGFTADQITRWLNIATTTMFDDTCRRFPGSQSYTRLRPVVSASCLTPLPPNRYGHLGLDLWPTVRYPVLELVDVEIDGVSVGTAGWRIEGRRWLVPEGSTSWPAQDLHEPAGGAGTWSVTVRYGRDPHPMVVAARDQLMYQMILGNEIPLDPASVCTTPEGLTQITENGRTMTINPETAVQLHDEARKRWRCRGGHSGIVDPAERNARGSSTMHVVPGDPTPAEVAVWLPSGCDIQGQLDAIAGGP